MDTRWAIGTRLGVLLTIVALATACGGGGSGGGTTPGTLPDTVSGLQILTQGGEGFVADGGDGGNFDFQTYTGGNMEIRRTGVVDTSFTVPTVTPEMGPNPLTVTADVTLTPDGSWHVLGDDGINPATGLHVLPGVTLTLRGNVDTDGVPATMERARLDVDDAILIDGTLTGHADDVATGDGLSPDGLQLELHAGNLLLGPTGTVRLRGDDAGPGGGDGGNFKVYTDRTILSQGQVVTRGGDGDVGGDGGDVYWHTYSYGALYVTGDVDASGGTGLNGVGGGGGWYETHTEYGPQCHSAHVLTRGGNGTLGGGDGGSIYFDVCDVGLLLNAGDLDSSGGDATLNGHGGDADYIEVYYYTGPVRLSGTYVARGGAGAGSGDGGSGGDFEVYGYEDYIEDTYVAYGFVLGAGLDLRGGNGQAGGPGGSVDLYVDFDESHDPAQPALQSCVLCGYDRIVTSGGSGALAGGRGGSFDLAMEYGYNYDVEYIGSILNEADLDASGGSGAAGTGGPGGSVDMSTYDDATFYFDRLLRNTGAIDTRGGNGGTAGGDGGYVYLYEYVLVDQLATIRTSGGSGTSGPGGNAGALDVVSDQTVNVSGVLRADGGDSTGAGGGNGGEILVYGQHVTCVGDMSSRGGAATGPGTGGDGNGIEIGSTAGPSLLTGTYDVSGGLGTKDGAPGEVWLDGVNWDLTGGTVTRP
jgi:hypothetical protein